MSYAPACSRLTVVYDGRCAYCRKQVAWIQARDAARRFSFISSHETNVTERFPALQRHDLSTGLRVVAPSGRVYVGADAVHAIAARLPRWRWVAWLYLVPGIRQLARMQYARIAARRNVC